MQTAGPPLSRRERLVAAGREAFGRKPYDEVSVSDVADDAGVAHGLPYHYFGNKRGFYVEVVRSLAGELRVVHEVPAGLPPDLAVRHLLDRHVRYMEGHPNILLGPARGGLGVDPAVQEVVDTVRWDGARYVLDLFGVAAGPAARLFMHGWLSYLDDVLARWLTERSVARSDLVEALAEALRCVLGTVARLDPAAPGRVDATPPP